MVHIISLNCWVEKFLHIDSTYSNVKFCLKQECHHGLLPVDTLIFEANSRLKNGEGVTSDTFGKLEICLRKIARVSLREVNASDTFGKLRGVMRDLLSDCLCLCFVNFN
jgi:hypothetical protein